MLTNYFVRPSTYATYAASTDPHLDPFTVWLEERGYGRDAVRCLIRGAADFATWIRHRGDSLTPLPCDACTRYCDYLREHGRLFNSRGGHSVCWRGAQHFEAFLRTRQGVSAVDTSKEKEQPEIVDAFEHWMHVHHGVRLSTLSTYRRHVIDLLSSLGEQIDQFSAAKLREFILAFANRSGCAVAQTRVSATRMFVRFLIATGRCQSNLEGAIPTVAKWRLATLPRYLSPDDVKQVLLTSDGARPIYIRDKAILLLLVRLGLRASEVAGLRFDDIDWAHGTVAVIGKSRREVKLPLPQDVGDAILRYLKNARPSVASNYIFFTAIAPWVPTTRYVIKHVAARAIRRAGVKSPSLGSHVLRHSAATGMLRQGASLQVIGEVLRHRSIDTTALYAKVDVALLQKVTRSWPGASSC